MEFVKLSQDELANGQPAPETVEKAASLINLNGFVVLENAVPTDLIARMNDDWQALIADMVRSERAGEKTEMNTSPFRKNRVRMNLPFRDPYTDPQIITNQFALPIIDRILGDDCRMFYLSVDAPMPGSDYQMVHGDYMPFYPDSDMILPVTGMVVNYPLIDVSEQNGPLEVWPSTHLTPEKVFTGDLVEVAAKSLDPVRVLMPRGALIIRDIRMWHRGSPNVSDVIRPNVALIYGRGWWDAAQSYPQGPLGITRDIYPGLSERAKKLFRFEPLVDDEVAV